MSNLVFGFRYAFTWPLFWVCFALVGLLVLWAFEPKSNKPEEKTMTVFVFSADGSKKLGSVYVPYQSKEDPPGFLRMKTNATPDRFFKLVGLDSEVANANWCYWEITDDIYTVPGTIQPVEAKVK